MDEEIDPEIAAAMGFSSFGGTKRKYDDTHSPKSKATSSGANTTKLGVRSKLAPEDEHSCEAGSEIRDPESDTVTADGSTKPAKVPEATGLAAFLSRGKDLESSKPDAKNPVDPSRAVEPSPSMEPPMATFSFGGLPISQPELDALRKGVQNAAGDMAYFLPSFVEDPWERLRKN
ncbi:hypothetical protein BCR34DRAFT_491675 [Clohesyomyces aquaticus]|uniref:Uncharacterized protein n=1 Tax=Clohesyomyces aquaticus TaxID=1231657 RepID=A0A1Y1Z1X7_9PLEO|nr:hypothetical protein BCR34DRAFT_491675 [Clohesyomyces aquaticus]